MVTTPNSSAWKRAWLPTALLLLAPVAAGELGGDLAYVANSFVVLVLFGSLARRGLRKPRMLEVGYIALSALVFGAAALHGIQRGNDLRYLAQDCFWLAICIGLVLLRNRSSREVDAWFVALGAAASVHFLVGLPTVLAEPFDRSVFFQMAPGEGELRAWYLGVVPGGVAVSIMLLSRVGSLGKLGKIIAALTICLSLAYIGLSVTRTYFLSATVGLGGFLLYVERRAKGVVAVLALSTLMVASGAWSVVHERMQSEDAKQLGGRVDEVEQLIGQLESTDDLAWGRGLGGIFTVWRNQWQQDKGLVPHIEPLWVLLKVGFVGSVVVGLLCSPFLVVFLRMLARRRPHAWAALSMIMMGFSGGNVAHPFSWAVWIGIALSVARPMSAAQASDRGLGVPPQSEALPAGAGSRGLTSSEALRERTA